MEFDKQQEAIKALLDDVRKREEVCLLRACALGTQSLKSVHRSAVRQKIYL